MKPHQQGRCAMKTFTHFRTHDQSGFHWDPFYTVF